MSKVAKLGRPFVRAIIALVALSGFGAAATAQDRVVIFYLATGFVHDSIPDGVAATEKLARAAGLQPVSSNDPAIFDKPLTGVAAVVLMSTTTDPKNPASEWFKGARADNFQRYVEGGGGVVAVHAAADSHYNWPWYGKAIGGYFLRHPRGTPVATIDATRRSHPARGDVPARFSIADEWYAFKDLAPELDHLLTFQPTSIGEPDGNPRPLAWAHNVGKGRVFYTGLGHRRENWQDARVLAHVDAGLRWAAHRVVAKPMRVIEAGATPAAKDAAIDVRKQTLARGASAGQRVLDADQVVQIVSGEAEITADGKTRRLPTGATAYVYEGAKVDIRQRGAKPLTFVTATPGAE